MKTFRPDSNKGSPVRVALCASGEIWGGVEQFIETLSRELLRRQVPVMVIVLFDGPLLARLKTGSVPVALITGDKYDPRTILSLRRLLRRERVNVLHTHGYKAAVVGSLAARLAGVRHVRTEHGRVEPWAGRARIKMAFNARLENGVARWLTDTVVFVSHDIERQSPVFGRSLHQQVIYNGIEPTTDTGVVSLEHLLPAPEDAFNLGIVGRVAPVKGHLHLLQAMAQLADAPTIHLHVIGSGPLEGECRRLARALGLERVHFLGFKTNVHDYLRQLDAMVMPSLYEGLPYALLEAMEHRVPLIASDVGGLAEVLADGVTALLTPPADVPRLTAAIRRLSTDRTLRRSIAEAAHALVRRQFLVEVMASRYLDVYAQAVEANEECGA